MIILSQEKYKRKLGTYMKWGEVVRLHGTTAGIGVKKGVLQSLLLTVGPKAKYPNRFDGETITYHVPAHLAGAKHLLKARDEGMGFTVFQKIHPDEWVDLGRFKVTSYTVHNHYYEFILIRTS